MVHISFYSHKKFICHKQPPVATPGRIMYSDLFQNTFCRVYILIVYDFIVNDLCMMKFSNILPKLKFQNQILNSSTGLELRTT